MGGRLIPQDIIQPNLKPIWKNIFENSTMVQFDHRLLGISTLTAITVLFCFTRKIHRRIPGGLPLTIIYPTNALMTMGWIQVTLGISTLLLYVPVSLATVHQAGSLTLLTIAIWLLHVLSPISRIITVTATTIGTAAAGVTAASFVLITHVENEKQDTQQLELIEQSNETKL
jgi:cytochrome c oxidase assembly protein subunit 15